MTTASKNIWRGGIFILGATFGFQLLAVIHLLPLLSKELDPTFSMALLVGASFIVLLVSQFEMGKKIAHLSAVSSIRDSIFALAITFLVFTMAPHAFWLFISFLAWLLALSAVHLALGRWTLLTNQSERDAQLRILLTGFCAGLISSRITIVLSPTSLDPLVYIGLAISGIAAFIVYVFGNVHATYSSAGQLWFMSEAWNDRPLHALVGISFGLGLALGLPGFYATNVGLIIVGIGAQIVVSKKFGRRLDPEHLTRLSSYALGLLLIVDAFSGRSLFFGAFGIGFHGALVYSAVRLDAYRPKTLMTSGDRLAFHNTGIVAGIMFQGILSFLEPTPAELLVGNGVFIAGIGYLLSFLPAVSAERM